MDALLVGLRPSAGQTLKKPLPISSGCSRWRSGHHATKPMVLPWVMVSGEKEALSFKKGGVSAVAAAVSSPRFCAAFFLSRYQPTIKTHPQPKATK